MFSVLNTRQVILEFGKLDKVIKEKIPSGKEHRQYKHRYAKDFSLDDLIADVRGEELLSIGSLGGGNHFIEYGEYEGGSAWTVHCGSRNFGVKVAKYWTKIASSNQVDNKLLKETIKELKKNIENKKVKKSNWTEKHAVVIIRFTNRKG